MKKRILFIDDDQEILTRYRNIVYPEQPKNYEVLDMISEKTSSDGSDFIEIEMSSAQSSHINPLRTNNSYDCTFCSQGLRGVGEAREGYESGQPFSAVFVDMRMPPGIDGLETIRRIREIDDSVSFIMVTAYSEYALEDVMIAAKYQNAAILRKPFKDNDILNMISRYVL